MRSTNKSFYHYTITPFDSESNTFGEKEYYFTWKDIKDKYQISRQTIYRIVSDPENVKTRFKHLIEKTFIHVKSIQYLI